MVKPLKIVVVIAAVLGAGVGGFLVFRGEKNVPSGQTTTSQKEASSSATTTEAATQSPETPEKPPAAKTAPPTTYKTFEFETIQQNIFARFEAPGDWTWKDNFQPSGTGGNFICRPQSRGYGCVSIWLTKGASGMGKEANDRFEERKARHPETTFKETTIAGRHGYLWEEKYETAVGVPREYYLNPELYPNVQKKWITDRAFYFLLPGFDFYATIKDFGAFRDQPEIVNTFEQIVKTLRLVDTSPQPEPKPTEQKPILQPMADDLWCPKQVPTVITNPLSGEKSIQEVLGVESVTIESVLCRACHRRTTSESTGQILDQWSDLELWGKQGFLNSRWACLRATIGSGMTEKWPGPSGEACFKQNGVYQMGSAALCE